MRGIRAIAASAGLLVGGVVGGVLIADASNGTGRPSIDYGTPTTTMAGGMPKGSGCMDVTMAHGETRHFSAGTMGVGDVLANGQQTFDVGPGSENTGEVFVLDQDADITAPWGADVRVGANCPTPEQQKASEEQGAPGKRFDVVHVPGGHQ